MPSFPRFRLGSRSVSLQSKLLSPIIAVVVVFGLASAVFSLALYRMRGGLTEVSRGSSRAAALTQVATLLAEEIDIEKTLLLTRDPTVLSLRQYAGTARQIASALDEVGGMGGDSSVQQTLVRWRGLAEQHEKQHGQLVAAVRAGDMATAMRISSRDAEPLVRGLFGEINSSLRMEQLDTERNLARLDRDRKQTQIMLAITLVLAAAIVGLLALMIRRGVVRPVSEIATVAERIAGGNLRELAPVRTQDEVGRTAVAVNRMVENLRALIAPIQTVSLQLAENSGELEVATKETGSAVEALQTAIEHINSGAQHQASSVQETVGVVVEIGSSMRQVVGTAQEVAAAADQTMALARSGGDTIGAAVAGMMEVRNIALETAERIRALAKRSQQIGGFLATIRSIADQTNLLALNAAIEAARAGEQGRGFAVVSGEVRKLAEQSRRSAKEVAEIVEGLRTDSQSAVARTERATEEVEQNTELARAAGQALQEIMEAMERTAAQVHGIATSAHAVLPRTDEVSRLVESVAAVADQNAAASQEMASMSEQVSGLMHRISAVSRGNGAESDTSLARTATLLRSLVERFHV